MKTTSSFSSFLGRLKHTVNFTRAHLLQTCLTCSTPELGGKGETAGSLKHVLPVGR